MLNVAARALTFIRARWRWTRGRCPRCSRNLYAAFPYFMADDPHCPVCKEETRTDLRMWHRYRASVTARRPDVAATGGRIRAPERALHDRFRAVAFDLDAASLISLGEALPGWEIEVINGATAASLSPNWNPGAVNFLVVGSRANAAETLGLCRFLSFCTSYSSDSRPAADISGRHGSGQNQGPRADAPLLVLVPPGQAPLVRAALDAGAHSCLVLPIHAKEVASMLVHARAGNQPGRHTLDLEGTQTEDRWRDDGGQG